jgi:hypothetical protein
VASQPVIERQTSAQAATRQSLDRQQLQLGRDAVALGQQAHDRPQQAQVHHLEHAPLTRELAFDQGLQVGVRQRQVALSEAGTPGHARTQQSGQAGDRAAARKSGVGPHRCSSVVDGPHNAPLQLLDDRPLGTCAGAMPLR